MRVTKQQAAEANLDAAISAFLRGDWVPAIHLAGAAEEVFGRLEEAKGGKTVPDFFWGKTDFKDSVAQFIHWYEENIERINRIVENWPD